MTAGPAQAAHPFDPAKQTSISLHAYTEVVRPIGTAGGVQVSGDGFGSAVAPVPGHKNQVYGLTDRGPNVDGPNDTKIEPFPDFTPAIGKFTLKKGKAKLVKRLELRAADGTPFNGQVDPQASTGETITDLKGKVLPTSPYGYDSEGLVALKDGTFWVSDEYGPFITHFDQHGRALSRLSPYDQTLPKELALRTPNRGMEGLTITPDGKTLVGMMQSALTQADASKPKSVAVTRIVTVDLRTL
ncbi:MAG: esterase-like activity of phytase family protein, partial [Janthinobacterium lividum]